MIVILFVFFFLYCIGFIAGVYYSKIERSSKLEEIKEKISKKDTEDSKPFVSVCCNSHFTAVLDLATEQQYRCSACKALCEIHQPPKATIYKLKLELLEQLREEDVALVEMAEKMGYSGREEVPTTVINHKPNVLVINSGDKSEQEVVEDYTKLKPMDRERLLEKLKKEIVQMDAEEGSIEVVPDKSATAEATSAEVVISQNPLSKPC